MFFGAVPTDCIQQVFKIMDIEKWADVHVCCSGSFRLERALSSVYEGLRIHSNDVSVYSAAIGGLATGKPIRVSFVNELEFVGEHIEGASDVQHVAAILVGCEMSRYARGKTRYNTTHFAFYREHFAHYMERTAEKVERTLESLRVQEYFGGDWREHAQNAVDMGSAILAFPPFFCMAPDERVLMADLSWRAVGDVKAGDRLLAFEEHPTGGRRCRRWQISTVLRSEPASKPCVRVHLSDGRSVECSEDHPWLVDRYVSGGSREYRNATDIEGWFVNKLFEPWVADQSYEAGYLAGLLDGEGSLTFGSAPKLTIAQNQGAVLERAKAGLRHFGADFTDCLTKDRLHTLHVKGGPGAFLELLGRVRAERLIGKLSGIEDMTTRSCGNGKVRVDRVERLGAAPVQSLMTSSKTYIGEGYMMHNSGDYEAQFKFIESNIEWDAPDYEIYNPKDLREIARGLEDQGATYCILTDQIWDDKEPVIKYHVGRKVPHFCYANTPRSSYLRKTTKAQPFRYRKVDPAKLTKDTKVTIQQVDSAKLSFIKDVYLAKSIVHSTGFGNYLIYLDGMLAGGVIYDDGPVTRAAYGPRTLVLLSDVTTTTEGKLSKLVAMMGASRTLTAPLERTMLKRYDRVVTTARTKNPVSMKYRGIFKKLSRRWAEDEQLNIIQYGAYLTDETPQQIYEKWWTKYGPGKR